MIKFIADYTIKDIEPGTLQECLAFLSSTQVIGVDTETTGLSPIKDKIIMLQIGNGEHQYVIDTRSFKEKEIAEILNFINISNILILGANFKFDYKFILNQYGIRLQNIFDVQIAEQVLNCGKNNFRVALKVLAEKYSDIILEKDEREEFTRIKNKKFNARQVIYGARDVECLFNIHEKQSKEISENQLNRCVYLENNFLKVVAEMEYNGMFVDKKDWLNLARENEKNMLEAREKLNNYILENNISKYIGTSDLFSEKPTILINWDSPKQIGPFLKSLGLPIEILDEEKSEELSELYGTDVFVYKFETGRPELEKYKEHPFIRLFLKYKKYQKAVNTYGKDWYFKYVDKDSRVRTSFKQILNTGRIASNSPNVQQIPSFKSEEKMSCEAHRTCFKAPNGWSLVVRDFSGCESRILADYSGEPSMIDFFLSENDDLHSFTASKVFKVPVSKKENKHLRQIGKTLNFAIPYGASGYKVSKTLQIPKEEGDKIVSDFYSAFPELDKYFKTWHKFVRNNGYILIDTYFNRRSYFPLYDEYMELKELAEERDEFGNRDKKILSRYMKLRGAMDRMAQNFKIQGTNANMTKMSMVMLYNYIRDNNLFNKIKIILSLHDEIVVEAMDDIADEVDKKLTEFMIQSGKYFCPRVPMKVDGGVTKIWDH